MALGARWDKDRQVWSAPPGIDLVSLDRWPPRGGSTPSEREPTDPSAEHEKGTALIDLLAQVWEAIERDLTKAVWVRAEISELRGKDGLPLHPDLALLLHGWLGATCRCPARAIQLSPMMTTLDRILQPPRKASKMTSTMFCPDRIARRNRLITTVGDIPPVLATLPDAGLEADDATERLFHHHRGAYADEGGGIVVFGNDGFVEDNRSRTEVAHVVGVCLQAGLTLEAFGVTSDGYSWALIVSCPSDELAETLTSVLYQVACDAWLEASGVPVTRGPMWAVRQLTRSRTARAMHHWSRDGFCPISRRHLAGDPARWRRAHPDGLGHRLRVGRGGHDLHADDSQAIRAPGPGPPWSRSPSRSRREAGPVQEDDRTPALTALDQVVDPPALDLRPAGLVLDHGRRPPIRIVHRVRSDHSLAGAPPTRRNPSARSAGRSRSPGVPARSAR